MAEDLPKPDPSLLLQVEEFSKVAMDVELKYAGIDPSKLTGQQEKFIHLIVSGMPNTAAAIAVGAEPATARRWLRDPGFAEVVEHFREKNRQKLEFTIETAHSMLMEAWTNSKDATEQVAVVRELVKLHGVAAAPKPQEVNINITNRKQVERASDEQLLELAGVDDTYLNPVPKIRHKPEPIVDAEFVEVKKET